MISSDTDIKTTTIADLITRWDTDEGKPYKGSLIDWDDYERDNSNIGCMCAQGQVLHLVGGWTAKQLTVVSQSDADKATANLLNISRSHAVLLRLINDKSDGAPSIVLTNPSAVLGDQWSKLLDFWWNLDRRTADHWVAARAAARAAAGAAAAWAVAHVATGIAADAAADAASRAAIGVGAWDTAGAASRAATGAANEIQGMDVLRAEGAPFFFLPVFGFASPDDIPPRPESYGPVVAQPRRSQ